jgi:hypothetical protein
MNIIVVPDRRQAFENTVELVAPNGRKSLTNVASKSVQIVVPSYGSAFHPYISLNSSIISHPSLVTMRHKRMREGRILVMTPGISEFKSLL